KSLAVQTHALYGHVGPAQSLVREFPPEVGRLDRRDPGDGDRVERNVVAAAEADFDDLAGQTCTDPLSQWSTQLAAAGNIDDPRQHSIPVEAHECHHPPASG